MPMEIIVLHETATLQTASISFHIPCVGCHHNQQQLIFITTFHTFTLLMALERVHAVQMELCLWQGVKLNTFNQTHPSQK